MDLDKILQAYVSRTQMSHVKILVHWANREQNGSEKGGCFFTMGTMKLCLFVAG